MRIDKKTYKAMPAHLQALFRAEPNPAREEVTACFPDVKAGVAVRSKSGGNTFGGDKPKPPMGDMGYGDSGSAARFFYCAKASRSERGESNTHPTVKPLALMRYLCRLVTPPGGLILDPFLGSGTTSLAAHAEGFASVGIEADPDHVRIVRERFAAAGIQYAGTHAKGG